MRLASVGLMLCVSLLLISAVITLVVVSAVDSGDGDLDDPVATLIATLLVVTPWVVALVAFLRYLTRSSQSSRRRV